MNLEEISAEEVAEAVAADELTFSGKIFPAIVSFPDKTFRNPVKLKGCVFRDTVNFNRSCFLSGLQLNGSVFEKELLLKSTVLGGKVLFDRMKTKSRFDLRDCETNDSFSVNEASFESGVHATNPVLAQQLLLARQKIFVPYLVAKAMI